MNISRFIYGHKLATIIVVGIMARVVLMPISAHPLDVYGWYKISMDIIRDGPFSIHSFAPLWYHYTMIPIAYTYDWLAGLFSIHAIPMSSLPNALNFYPSSNIQYVPGILFDSVVKFPLLISDLLVTLLLYKIVLELTNDKGIAEKAAIFWFINPFVIWISAGWGMWDTLPALFSLAAFFFVLKNRISLSAVFLSLGVACKLYPILFLIPITIYFFKSGHVPKRLKNYASFVSIFIATSVILFLPSIGSAGNLVNFFIINGGTANSAVINPVVVPVGFGLTYWSLYLLNRLVYLPINAGFVSFASAGSIVFVVISLTVVCWKIGKMTFRNRTFELATAMLLIIFGLFLSYRAIEEQWFIWALPFLIIASVGGRIKWAFYWVASLIALLYSILNCPLPFFFLPLAPWMTSNLLGIVNETLTVEPLRIVILGNIGLHVFVLDISCTIKSEEDAKSF